MKKPLPLLKKGIIASVVRTALTEDIGSGDITTDLLIKPVTQVQALILARQAGVVCGVPLLREVFRQIDPKVVVKPLRMDGEVFKSGAVIAIVSGKARSVLTGERVALNFLGRLSGIASLTRSFVDQVKGTRAVILDTRKTTPGLRPLERYAVAAGGGQNHRFNLADMVLVKDNHRFLDSAAGTLADMVRRLRAKTRLAIEVEVDTLEELQEVLPAKPDVILLDNMDAFMLQKAVRLTRKFGSPRPLLEASGGINLINVRRAAKAGVDRISIGALTHSAPCVDFSLDIRKADHV